MKKIDWVKVIGFACTVIGVAVNIVSGIVEDKKLDAKIDEKLQLKLTEVTKD